MEFPWETLKAETLRSISNDLLQGKSGKSGLITRTRESNISFLQSAAEYGVDEAIRRATESGAASTSASATRQSASASAPVKRKRDERDDTSTSRSTRSKGRADYPYSTRHQGKPQKQLEALGVTGPKRRKAATARPGPASRKGKSKVAKLAWKGDLVFDGVEISTPAANAADSVSQNGDDDEEREGEDTGKSEQAEMDVDGPSAEASNVDGQEGGHHSEEEERLGQDGEEEQHEHNDPRELHERNEDAEASEQSGADEPPPSGEIVEATPSEGQETSSAEVGTALEDPYVGGDEDAAGEPEGEFDATPDEGPVDATNEESMIGMSLDVVQQHPVPAV